MKPDSMKDARRRAGALAARVRRRDRREIVVALLLVPVFLIFAYRAPTTLATVGALIVAVSCAFIPLRLRAARLAEPAPRLPLSDALRAELGRVRAQERLLGSVAVWYLGPLGLGLALYIAGGTESVVFRAGSLVLLAALYGGVGWLNHRAVQQEVRPVARALDPSNHHLEGAVHRNLVSALFAAPVLIATLVATATPAATQSPSHPARLADGDSVQALLDARVAGGVAGVVAVTVQAGPPYRSAGVVDGRMAAPDSLTVFEIGSVSKALTGLLLAEMAARGEVSVDDPVSRHLPGDVRMPSYGGRDITLADLATHRSGLPRLPTNMMPVDLTNPYAAYDAARLHVFLDEHALRREPDSEYEYSNLGAGLLGHVLSLAAVSSYEALVIERVLEPLGMHDTRITPTPSMRARLATGHGPAGAAAPHWQVDVLAGAAGWLSTPADLRRLLAAAMDPPAGTLGQAFTLATQPRAETGQPDLRVGLGWHILGSDDDPIIWHNGRTGGFHAFVGYAPAHSAGVATLANSSVSLDELALHVLRMQRR